MVNHQVGDNMCECGAKKSPAEQKTCDHYEKATKADRCMYLKLDWICDYIKVDHEDIGY